MQCLGYTYAGTLSAVYVKVQGRGAPSMEGQLKHLSGVSGCVAKGARPFLVFSPWNERPCTADCGVCAAGLLGARVSLALSSERSDSWQNGESLCGLVTCVME